MTNIDSVLRRAVADGDVPFVVAMTGSSAGPTYFGAAGQAAPGRDADETTVFRMFSMTKAIGSLAAMVLIDRGLLDLETPVGDVLPDWNAMQVLDGFDGDTPVLRAPNTVATIRHLATHTSGVEYDTWSGDLSRYLKLTGQTMNSPGSRARLMEPLTFDPGARWGYGRSTDWLGQVVEAVDGRRIDAFCQAEIFDPLGMGSTAFEPDNLTDRLATLSMRRRTGEFKPNALAPPPRPEIYGMGHALYSTAPDYMRFLRMMLNRGQLDGARILSEPAIDIMLADQLNGLTFQKMISVIPQASADVEMPKGTTHSVGFMRYESDIPGKRSAGSQGWAGLCNTHFWFDPAKDLAAVLMTQTLPFMEPPMVRTYDAFERAVYAGL